MYLFLIVWLELYLLLSIPWLISLFLVAFYMLWYLDGKEYNGERRWEAFRRLGIWRWITPVDILFADRNDLQTTSGKRLFVFIPCSTPSSLIWAVGLHGGDIQFKNTIHYIVPPVFMWIPIVRDVLLWTGAITYSNYNENHSKYTIIFEMLSQGRSVAYTPSNFADKIVSSDLESSIEARYPSEEILKKIIEENVQVIPVVVQGEFDRYRIIQHHYVKNVQAFFYKHIDYIFPLCYWYKWYSHTRPPLINVQFGSIMSSHVYTTPQQLKEALKEKVARLIQPSFGDKDIKPQ
jgi:hypothetical protein